MLPFGVSAPWDARIARHFGPRFVRRRRAELNPSLSDAAARAIVRLHSDLDRVIDHVWRLDTLADVSSPMRSHGQIRRPRH